MRKQRGGGGLALAYLQGLGILVRTPSLLIAPFLMSVIGVLVTRLLGGSTDLVGAVTSGIGFFIIFLLNSFGLGVSLIIADKVWTYGRASFEDAWSDARRKGGDILMAAIGFNFIVFIAQYAGSLIGGYIALLLEALALYFFIYAIPAAAIGGVPGGASLQLSIDRVRGAPLPTLAVTVLSIAAYIAIGSLAPTYVIATGLVGFGIGAQLLGAAFQAVAFAYIAVILARTYNVVSYGYSRF